ncbi:hypothetical protein Theos_2479 (plasmid) [Thermus oshimai JL-2]|uniref:Uncharacterized protein n=1 Tax=Thermus oshimai JL-2 TaxID=751945 RepID=K7R2C0_THEOS|nr:hypothetical protein [Thermus oshimai]AFV77455.1 hypothetical protein Theos_2479 [Thermus oshimai JL-2]
MIHLAQVRGVVHLSPLPGAASLRLEAPGLFSKRVRAQRGLKEGPLPGLYRVVLHPRTDGEGFLTGLRLAHRELLSPAPVGEAPGEPLRFLLLGEWLGAWEGLGRVRVVPRPKAGEPETRPFVLRFLLRRPHLAPAPGGLVLALGRVERGRLVGEAFPLTPRALP